jgi:hypothetical protein
MTERGATHLKACCVVAGHLAERAWAVLNRGTPYVICDTNGNPVTAAEAKAIIAERWTVPETSANAAAAARIAGRPLRRPQPGRTDGMHENYTPSTPCRYRYQSVRFGAATTVWSAPNRLKNGGKRPQANSASSSSRAISHVLGRSRTGAVGPDRGQIRRRLISR